MAVFPGCIYGQLPQYHDGRAPAWEEPRDERMVGVHGDRGRDDVDREIPVLGRVVGSTGNIALDAREPQTVAAHHPSKGHAAGQSSPTGDWTPSSASMSAPAGTSAGGAKSVGPWFQLGLLLSVIDSPTVISLARSKA